MRMEPEEQSPLDRAQRYLARAEEARLMASQVSDPHVRNSLVQITADWEILATYALNQRGSYAS